MRFVAFRKRLKQIREERREQTDKEKENTISAENSNVELERLSVREKLRKYEQEVRERRTEQLQSEKNQETIGRRGMHR